VSGTLEYSKSLLSINPSDIFIRGYDEILPSGSKTLNVNEYPLTMENVIQRKAIMGSIFLFTFLLLVN